MTHDQRQEILQAIQKIVGPDMDQLATRIFDEIDPLITEAECTSMRLLLEVGLSDSDSDIKELDNKIKAEEFREEAEVKRHKESVAEIETSIRSLEKERSACVKTKHFLVKLGREIKGGFTP